MGVAHARASLAKAIAARDELERQLVAARDAVEQAQRSKWSAQNKLDALRTARAEAASAQSLGATFIASVQAGSPCGLDTLERPSTFDRDEAALEREIEVWAATQRDCEAEIPAIEAALCSMNDFAVDQAAREVIRTSGTVTSLLEGLDELHDELDRRLSMLGYLHMRNMLPDTEKPIVQSAICRMMKGQGHPAYAQMNACFESLKRDADAPLP